MTLYDVKRLRPTKNMKQLMLNDMHVLQAIAREPSYDRKTYREIAGPEIRPVVFGEAVTYSLFGKGEGHTLNILGDLGGLAPNASRKWNRQPWMEERLLKEMQADANKLGIPAFLQLVGVYDVPERAEITDGRRKVLQQRHFVQLFKTVQPIQLVQLLAAQELTATQIVQSPDELRWSKNFRIDLEVGCVNVARADTLRPKARKAAEGRAKELADYLDFRVGTPDDKAAA